MKYNFWSGHDLRPHQGLGTYLESRHSACWGEDYWFELHVEFENSLDCIARLWLKNRPIKMEHSNAEYKWDSRWQCPAVAGPRLPLHGEHRTWWFHQELRALYILYQNSYYCLAQLKPSGDCSILVCCLLQWYYRAWRETDHINFVNGNSSMIQYLHSFVYKT